MYGMRSESVRVRRSRSPAASTAARSAPRSAAHAASSRQNLSALLERNLKIARVIAFETSTLRLLTRHAYKNALVATRRLTGDLGKMKRSARTSFQTDAVQQLEMCLRQSRINAMVKSVSVSVAQDVFVLLSHYLGLCSVPEKSAFDAYVDGAWRGASVAAAKSRASTKPKGSTKPRGSSKPPVAPTPAERLHHAAGSARVSEKGVPLTAQPLRAKQQRVWYRRSVSHKNAMVSTPSTNSIGNEAYSAPPPPVSYLSMPNVMAVAQKRKVQA